MSPRSMTSVCPNDSNFVFEVEPVDPNNALLHMDNVLVSPHIASATARMAPETRRRLGREALDEIARLGGQPVAGGRQLGAAGG